MHSVPAPLMRLLLPAIPDVFERALGYSGDARYLLVYWEPAGDELMWDDGQRATCGEWQSYLLFIHHPRIAPALHTYTFGGSDAPARDGLVLDRQERVLYAGPIREARRLVQDQHSPRPSQHGWRHSELHK
jgi:hypothetical protein